MSTRHFSALQAAILATEESSSPFVAFMGEIGLARELLFLASTHALHYASSVFEGIRAFRQHDGQLKVWLLDAHLDRFEHSLRLARMVPPVSREVMTRQILDLVALHDDGQSPSVYIRPFCLRGEGLGVDASDIETYFAVLTRPWGAYVANSYNGGAKVYVSPRSRPTADMVNGTAKLAGFYGLWSVPEKLVAKAAGCDEAIFAPNLDQCLQDGTGQEIMVWTKSGERLVLARHRGSDGANILHSTTRAFLTEGLTSEHAKRFPYREVPAISLHCDPIEGMALVGTASGVVPVTRLHVPQTDGTVVEIDVGDGHPHPQAVDLATFYRRVVSGMYPEYDHLLTLVPDPKEVITRAYFNNELTESAHTRWGLMSLTRQQERLPL